MPPVTKTRIAWEDKFRTPTPEELLLGPSKQPESLIAECRERLMALEGVTEELSWHGVPWRWTFAYRMEDAEDTRPLAYVVPQPGKGRVSIPLTHTQIAALPLRKLSKFIRDGLLHAPDVGGVRWVQWEPTAKSQIDEIMKIAEVKLGLCRVAQAAGSI